MAMKTFEFDVTATVVVSLDESLVPDDEWRSTFYPHIKTLADVASHAAYNAAVNNVTRLTVLDGFCDRDDKLLKVDVEWHEPEMHHAHQPPVSDNLKTVEFTPQLLEQFKLAHAAAVAASQNEFMFQGNEYLVAYARYLIEYSNDTFWKQSRK